MKYGWKKIDKMPGQVAYSRIKYTLSGGASRFGTSIKYTKSNVMLAQLTTLLIDVEKKL